jgi:predicted metal-binding membrane protein
MSPSPHASDRAFLGVAALLFVASAAITIVSSISMSAMPGMPMPGGWTMTMVWMGMGGQTRLGGAASFLAMWMVMMVAMMLPSLVPALRRYRQSVRMTGGARLGLLTALAGAGYFFVWAVIGMAIYSIGTALAKIAMEQPAISRAVPIVTAGVVLMAVVLQFSGWKRRQLACCRAVDRARGLTATAGTSWGFGMRLGLDCVRCCANLMAILLGLGVMDPGVMAAVTAAITLERFYPFSSTPAGASSAP